MMICEWWLAPLCWLDQFTGWRWPHALHNALLLAHARLAWRDE